MKNLFTQMFEAPGDPPEISDAPEPTVDSPPTNDSPTDNGGELPGPGGPPDMGDLSEPTMGTDEGGFDDQGGMDDGTNGEQEVEDTTTLDEKGEIFAKVKILKNFQYLYRKIDDTLSTIDKIDLVQAGNQIKSTDVSDVKDKLSELMEDVYVTIVYEFQMQYSNLKVKLVEYSSRYIMLTKSLVRLIKKDQSTTT